MNKLEKLESRFKKYQRRYQKLLKADKASAARYGNEERNMQLRVLESAMADVKEAMVKLKKSKA